jgi:hypothetical protein
MQHYDAASGALRGFGTPNPLPNFRYLPRRDIAEVSLFEEFRAFSPAAGPQRFGPGGADARSNATVSSSGHVHH